MHHARYMHVLFLDVNVNADVDLGFATFTHPNRRSTLQSMEVIVNVIVIVEKHTSRSLVIVNVIVIVNVLGELRFAKILKYQPHLIAGEVA